MILFLTSWFFLIPNSPSSLTYSNRHINFCPSFYQLRRKAKNPPYKHAIAAYGAAIATYGAAMAGIPSQIVYGSFLKIRHAMATQHCFL